MLSGNRGEWSEVYVLFRLLGAGEVNLADSNLLDIPDKKFRVESVVRHESQGDLVFQTRNLQVFLDNGVPEETIPQDTFVLAADSLLKVLLSGKGKISHPPSDALLSRLRISTLKSSSSRKGDIGVVARDPYFGALHELEMSVKSQLGSPATLFNAGIDATNFRFVARRFRGRLADLPASRNEKRSPGKFVRALLSGSSVVEYLAMQGDQFERNLRMVDSVMPEIIGLMLLEYYGSSMTRVDSLTEVLIEQDPLEVGIESANLYYPHKVKCFLADCALGLRTSKSWNGSYAATGGYIVVRSDGSLACIHAFERNEFQNYLYRSTQFDSPSSSRHNYGYVVSASKNSDGSHDVVFDLNLQIRFT